MGELGDLFMAPKRIKKPPVTETVDPEGSTPQVVVACSSLPDVLVEPEPEPVKKVAKKTGKNVISVTKQPVKRRTTKKTATATVEELVDSEVHESVEQCAAVEDAPIADDVPPEGQNLEPVVMQLTIPNERMTEIVNLTSTLEPDKIDPVPYAPMNSYMPTSMTSMDSCCPDAFKTSDDKGGGAHNMVCFWCCHPIVDKEYGLPIRYDSVHNSFTLYGCFCSLECSAAQNFSMHMGSDRAWEIHSWIQLMARRHGLSGRVRPAPCRYLLKLFNGPMSIEEFRNAHKGLARTYVINIPPFIHISSQMEALNTSFLTR